MSTQLASVLAKNPGAIVEEIAKEHRVTTRDVVVALPQEMRKFIGGSAFIDVMKDVGGWGDVTLIVHTDDGIMEFGGPVPAGEVARGYYNVPGSKGFHGHLRHERCAGIAFVDAPVHGPPLRLDPVLQHRRRDHVQDLCRP